MNHYRFVPLPSNGTIAAAITLVVCSWFTVAAGYMLTDRGDAAAVDNVQHAVLMEEAAPSSPTPLPVAAAPDVTEKIVVEARRVRMS